MSNQVIEFKQGTSFSASCTYTPDTGAPSTLAGVTVTSAFRDSQLHTYSLIVTVTSPTTFTVIYNGDTSEWNTGTAYWDLRFDYGINSTFYTQTIVFKIIPQITPSPTA